MRIDHEIKKWLSVGVNMQGSYVYRNKAYSRFINSLVSVPLGTVYNEDGSINVTPVPGDGNTINLLLNQDKSVYRDNNQNFKLFLNPYIEIRPFKGMTIQSRLNASLGYDKKNYFQGIGSYQYYASDGPNASGTSASVYAQIDQNRSYNYKWENIFTYNFNIKKDHEFTVTAVTSWNHNQTDKSWQKQDNIKNNSYLWHNMDGTGIVYSNYTMSKGLGLVGRINYSYLGKYLFSASVRQDGSSRLAKGNKWSTFPAVSLGWRISDEKFMQGTSNWMNNLKLRLGYGVTGAASIDPYSSVATVELDGYYSLGGQKTNSYKFSENVANADLTWERSHNWNIGLDASFFNNRIDLSADYYITNTDGVIWKQNLPVVNGAYNASKLYYMSKNIAKTQNHGLELTLNTRNIVNKEFTWTSALTFTLNNEKVKSLIGGTADHVKNEDYYLSIGYPVNSFYAPKIDGMWQLGEETDAAAFGCAPGDIKINVPGMIKEADGKFYKVGDDGQPLTDKNGDIIYYTKDNKYTYSDADSQVLGHNAPKWTMGFQNSFTYKNFDLTIYAYFRWGQMINYEMLGWYDSTGKGNFPTYFNYWTESNPSNDFPALNANRETKSYIGYGSLNYVDGSFFKIKNITFTFCDPNKLSDIYPVGSKQNYFYGRVNNNYYAPSKYLVDCFDARYDKRWENSFTTAFSLFSMVQAGWRTYDDKNATITLTEDLCTKYGIDSKFVGKKIYPYVDVNAINLGSNGGNQYVASVWPKGEYSGDVNKLVKVKNPYVNPYPLAEDEDRFIVYLSKEYLSDAEKAKRGYICVNIDDLFAADGKYKETFIDAQQTNTYTLFPSLNKFNFNFEGGFYGSNLQCKTGDMFIMRMAEVYLIAAEAEERLGNGAKAAEYLNVLRKRACRNEADFEANMKLTTATEDDVLDEYARELCGEFTRWALLKRHKAFETRLPKYNPRAAVNFSQKNYLRPISYTFLNQIENSAEYGTNGY